MKFGQRFVEEQVPEWAKHYVSYDRIKDAIAEASRKDLEQRRRRRKPGCCCRC